VTFLNADSLFSCEPLVFSVSHWNEELRLYNLFWNLKISNPGLKAVSSKASPGWTVHFFCGWWWGFLKEVFKTYLMAPSRLSTRQLFFVFTPIVYGYYSCFWISWWCHQKYILLTQKVQFTKDTWYSCRKSNRFVSPRISRGRQIPPDYVVRLLEALSALCHFCLLDGGLGNRLRVPGAGNNPHGSSPSSSSSGAPGLAGHGLGQPTSSLLSYGAGGVVAAGRHAATGPGYVGAAGHVVGPGGSGRTSAFGQTTQLLNNLINVFIPAVPVKVIDS
jgi:hypothetical protein